MDQNKPLWVFLDEINTCDSMGLLSEIVCKKKVLGYDIPNNITEM